MPQGFRPEQDGNCPIPFRPESAGPSLPGRIRGPSDASLDSGVIPTDSGRNRMGTAQSHSALNLLGNSSPPLGAFARASDSKGSNKFLIWPPAPGGCTPTWRPWLPSPRFVLELRCARAGCFRGQSTRDHGTPPSTGRSEDLPADEAEGRCPRRPRNLELETTNPLPQ